jgi:erythromycin esterase-like protein
MPQSANGIPRDEGWYHPSTDSCQVDSWNLRDRHMFDTLDMLRTFQGPEAKAVVRGHNSRVGNAAATEMGARGEFNVGQVCRERLGLGAFSPGVRDLGPQQVDSALP